MPKGSKNRAQEASKTPLGPVPALRGSRELFWTDFWSPRDLKTHDFTREGRQKSRFSCLASGQQNRAQNDPQMRPKSTQKQLPEGQNVAQKRCWIAGPIFYTDFESVWGSQKASQKAPKIAQNSPSAPQARPEASRDPPGGLQGAILASFWAPGSLFSSFSSVIFRSLRAPHYTIENTVRNHFPKDLLRPLRDRCAKHRRLSGRFGAAGPLEIRPLSLQAHLRP